jgi:acetyl esterase/lipase
MPIGRERLTRRSFGAGIAALAAALSSPGIRSAMASPLIVVDQLAPLFDAAVAIELRGFPPRQPITITAIQTYPNMSSWQGRATFLSDDDSCVYLARQAPISGTYDGVSAMGLIWSAELLPGQTKMPPPGSIMQPKLVQLEATSPDGIRAELMLERHVAGPGVARHPIRTEGIVGTLFLPANSGPHPAVIVLNGGDGGIDEYRGAIVASHGYAALNLGYFGMDGLPRGLVNIPLEYFGNAIRWMRTQPSLGDRFLAVWGESRGGELALLLGATFTEIKAVIAWVPSGVVFGALGLAEPGDTRPRAAWTFQGKPLSYLQENNTSMGTLPRAEAGQALPQTCSIWAAPRRPMPRPASMPGGACWNFLRPASKTAGRLSLCGHKACLNMALRVVLLVSAFRILLPCAVHAAT